MSNIIDSQDIIIAKIEALIAATTIDANFTVQDNSIDKGSLPLVVVDIVTSETKNLSGGDTGFTGFKLELSVLAPISDHSKVYRDTHEFVINAITIIINNLQLNVGALYHKNVIWFESKCALAYCEIEHLG